MTSDNDLQRYVEYLQGQLIAPEWSALHDLDNLKNWLTENRSKLNDILLRQGHDFTSSPVSFIEKAIHKFKPNTKYDLPEPQQIFQSKFQDVQKIAEDIGLKPIRDVLLATSPNAGVSPISRPSSQSHMLFVGHGTMSFCNYWAKVYTALVKAISQYDSKLRILSVTDLENVFKHDPNAIILASRLTIYHAMFGTLMGFGVVAQPSSYLPNRIELLSAMEVFAISHEYAHFVAEERLLQFQGSLDNAKSQELEFFCDRLGIQICHHYGSKHDNFLAFSGSGAIVFFRAMQLHESARELFKNSALCSFNHESESINEHNDDNTHPPFDSRIENLKRQIVQATVDDQRQMVVDFFEEYDRIAIGLNKLVLEILVEVLNVN
jgi:hypothetical protein